MTLAWSLDKAGPLCRSAEDCALLLHALQSPDGKDLTVTDLPFNWDATAILVPSQKVAEPRLELASAGLPKTGRIGFELFGKANFGASEFTEQVNYHRAIEGELERSVMSLREVEQARVHLTLGWAKDSLYTEQRQPAKASIGEAAPRFGAVSTKHRRHLPIDRQRRAGTRAGPGVARGYEWQSAQPAESIERE
jgi:Asp-tRNA(Asn)/Glu-tRNA(Gln) amidotransferase A subunit family amidase